MNNINIKSKKTRTLNSMRYMQISSKYDPFYANIYCIMASKRTNQLSKTELKVKLASLYDARLSVTQSFDNNIISIRYTLTSIIDKYLPEPVSDEVDLLFSQLLEEIEFSEQEILEASRELGLYVKNYYDNKQNIANSKLGELIDATNMKLSVDEIIKFYEEPMVNDVKKWIKTVSSSEQVELHFNNGEPQFTQQYSNLNFQLKQYVEAPNQVIDLGLDQTYIAIGYQLAGDNVTLNNIANLIFGGGVYSKLFKVVREEHSLSYNIRSTLLTENLITVSGGINNEKVDLAISEIDKQLELLRNGHFEKELELAKTNYIENLKRSKSNEMAYISMYGDNYLKQLNRTHQSIIDEIENITLKDVQAVFKGISRKTTVFVK